MVAKGSACLADDHHALDQLLAQLQAALDSGEVDVSHSTLDLFWAKLAVHIRAEHLHLFPALTKGVAGTGAHRSSAPATPGETRAVIERLQTDHNFFMHQLARAVESLRTLLTVSDRAAIDKELTSVRGTISEIERKLVDHNRVEENQIYPLAGIVLNSEEQTGLAKRIITELENRPPRFAANVW